MTSQVVPLETIEDENLNSERSESVVQTPIKQILKAQVTSKKRATVQLENEVEEEVNSVVHLSIIIMAIQVGFFALGYSFPYLSSSFSTVFSQITLQGTITSEQGLFSAVLSIGCLVGSVMTYFLLKYATRNQSLIIADLCGILSILQIIPNREIILAFRFFFGVCLGISCIITPIYVKELCPQKYYERLSVMAGFLVGGGLLFANLMGLGYLNENLRGENTHYWQIVFAIPAIICFCRLFTVTILYRMDSPISLLQKEKLPAVKAVIAKIYQQPFREQAYRKCLLRLQYNEEHLEGLFSIFTKKHRTTLSIGCFLMFIYTWSGLYAVFSYSSQFFDSMSDGDITMNTIFTLIIGIAQFLPAFFSQFVYTRWGKRSILLSGLLFMICCQIIIIGLSYSEEMTAVIIKFIVICFFAFVYALALGPITWSMTAEINSSEGTYFCYVTLFAWQLIILYLFPLMLDALKMSGSFIVFTILTILSIIYFFIFVKETKGLNHAEIDKMYGKEHH